MIKPRFRLGFRHLVDEYREEISKKVNEWLSYKSGLEHDANWLPAFQLIMRTIISRSSYFEGLLEKFKAQFPEEKWTPIFFESTEVKKTLNNLKHRNKGDIMRKVEKFLHQMNTVGIAKWAEGRLELARKESKDVFLNEIDIGEKGRDDLLRSLGYFDRIPIDRHERRFQIRTGIFHYCCERGADPESDYSYRISLTRFCRRYLKTIKVNNLNLGENPGILDGIIFEHCSDKRRNICRNKPDCKQCILAEHKACLLDILAPIRTHKNS